MPEIIISDKHGVPTVSSLEVAEHFDKKHKHVLRDIKNIKAQIWALTPNSMFYETTYQSGTGKHYKCYEVTRNGFTLLAMGFTGKKALEWKIKYIQAFNEMEQRLLTNEQKHDRLERKTNVLV